MKQFIFDVKESQEILKPQTNSFILSNYFISYNVLCSRISETIRPENLSLR